MSCRARNAASGAGILPNDTDLERIVRAYEFEKLLYELRYELNNRPDWVEIPARSLLEMEGLA